MTRQELHEKACSLPLKPGVYLMMNKEGTVIYVGKAKKLKNRVSQYFEENRSHNEKTKAMVHQVDRFDTIVVRTEFEALVLENSLIKRHQPRYNILLKDDKGYPFIRMSDAPYPRFSLINKPLDDSASYFGPFGGRGETKNAIHAVLGALKLPTCSKTFPRDIGKERPCLNYHIGKCDGFCRTDGPDQAEYNRRITQATQLFSGKLKEVQSSVEEEMMQAAEDLQFEKAAMLRDRAKALDVLKKQQQVIAGVCADTDVWGLYEGEVRCGCSILHIEQGNILSREMNVFPYGAQESLEDILDSLLLQYYLDKSIYPKEILLPISYDGAEVLGGLLSEQCHHKVEVHVPQRGQKSHLVEMAESNAKEEVERITTDLERLGHLGEQLRTLANLPIFPHRIESFDISNTGNADIVASMVVFVDGKPLKKGYRKFSIENLAHPDDYASMYEVVTRRLNRYLNGDEKFSPLPDLFLIDGGLQHIRTVAKAMEDLGVSVPILGMVKDDHHKTRALISLEGQELGIQNNPPLYAFIGRIQEEVHRSAITFHRQKHLKSTYRSRLDGIPGLGDARKSQLKQHFGSIKNIESASLEELLDVLPSKTAQAVYRVFHEEP